MAANQGTAHSHHRSPRLITNAPAFTRNLSAHISRIPIRSNCKRAVTATSFNNLPCRFNSSL